jgi:hypothetical protein
VLQWRFLLSLHVRVASGSLQPPVRDAVEALKNLEQRRTEVFEQWGTSAMTRRRVSVAASAVPAAKSVVQLE